MLLLYGLRSVYFGGQAEADFVAYLTDKSREFLGEEVARL